MSVLINDLGAGEAVKLILAELSATNHRVYPIDSLRRTALMCEEAGEALKAAIDVTRPGGYGLGQEQFHQERLFKETIQTGAMAIRLLVAMIQERGDV